MTAKELLGKTPDQLRESLVALKKEAFNLRFQQATNQLENTARMRAVRRDAARVKTVLNAKAAEAGGLPRLKLFSVDEVFGGWRKAQQAHFADGASFDQVFSRR